MMLSEEKEATERVLRELPSRFNIFNMLALYKYISTKNVLIDKGYNLDNLERENAFIEIITKNEPEVITLLEKHLEMSDSIQDSASLLKAYSDFFEKIKTTNNIKEETIDFLAKFN